MLHEANRIFRHRNGRMENTNVMLSRGKCTRVNVFTALLPDDDDDDAAAALSRFRKRAIYSESPTDRIDESSSARVSRARADSARAQKRTIKARSFVFSERPPRANDRPSACS